MKGNEELESLYNHYKEQLFGDRIPPLGEKVSIIWSNRMTRAAGRCRTFTPKFVYNSATTSYSAPAVAQKSSVKKFDSRKRWEIIVSTHYHAPDRFPEELANTVVHEMIHILYDDHGKGFLELANTANLIFDELNITVYANGPAKVGYVYECMNCHIEYERAKRLKGGGKHHHCQCGGALMEIKV